MTTKPKQPEKDWGKEGKEYLYPDTYNGEEIPFEFECDTISPGVTKLDVSDEAMKGYNMAKRMLQGKALEESPAQTIKENNLPVSGKKGRYFVGIDKELYYSPLLTIYDKMILLLIQDNIFHKTGFASLSIADISAQTKLGKSTVQVALKHLEELDIISIYKIPRQTSKIFIRDKYNLKRNIKKEDIHKKKKPKTTP